MGLRRRSRGSAADEDAPAAAPAVTAAAAAVTKKAGRAARRAGAAAEVAGEDLARRQPLTAARAKRLIGVGKAVAPLLAPYALAAAGVARGRWDEYRAARLGVEPGQLSAYAGPGGALHARLSRIAEALDRLDTGTGSGDRDRDGSAAGTFAATTRPRLADLAVAVRAAEQMPTARRRTAYRAISGELDRVETELLAHLGVPAG